MTWHGIQFTCKRNIAEIYRIGNSKVAILFLDDFHGQRQNEKS